VQAIIFFLVEFDAKSAAVKWIASAHVPSIFIKKGNNYRITDLG
jgi:hypothetical protein